jgi:hypothetical protein
MWVHWQRKRMRFTHHGTRVILQGVKDCTAKCTKIKSKNLKGLLRKGGVAQLVQLCAITPEEERPIPPHIQYMITRNSELFKTPTELPPSREFDHHIPLVPGAHPVNVKPYRYIPTQKDEIE